MECGNVMQNVIFSGKCFFGTFPRREYAESTADTMLLYFYRK